VGQKLGHGQFVQTYEPLSPSNIT